MPLDCTQLALQKDLGSRWRISRPSFEFPASLAMGLGFRVSVEGFLGREKFRIPLSPWNGIPTEGLEHEAGHHSELVTRKPWRDCVIVSLGNSDFADHDLYPAFSAPMLAENVLRQHRLMKCWCAVSPMWDVYKCALRRAP